MRAKFSAVAAFVGLLAMALSVFAHHNVGSVYERDDVTVKGTVTRFEWSNPHSIISFAVKTPDGKEQQWHAEVLPAAAMAQAGWNRDSVRVGDAVSLTGRPGKNAQHIMWLDYLVTADGRKLGRKPS